jgi:hypothetical protein
MLYLTLETNSLVDIVGRNSKDAIDWELIGTNAKTINLSPIRNAITNIETEKTIYLLPIINQTKADSFIVECATYEIVATMITQEDAESILILNAPIVV